MFLKHEKYKQLIFLALVISGSVILYTTNAFKNYDNYGDKISNNKENSASVNIDQKDVLRLSGIFLNKPNSQEGIDALYSLIVFWDKSGNDSSINSVMNTFEKRVKNNSLKNKLYSKLGRYFLAANRNQNSKTIKRILQESFGSENGSKSLVN